MVLSKQVSYRYHDKRKSPINGLFTPFMKLCLLFKLRKRVVAISSKIVAEEKKKSWKPLIQRVPRLVATIQTLGRRDLSGCFLVHICVFYSSYSSHFAFLYTSSKIFRAKMEPNILLKIYVIIMNSHIKNT